MENLKIKTVQVRVDEKLNNSVKSILGKLGLSPNQAIKIFYNQIVLQKRLPFEIALPEEALSDQEEASLRQNLYDLKNKQYVTLRDPADLKKLDQPFKKDAL